VSPSGEETNMDAPLKIGKGLCSHRETGFAGSSNESHTLENRERNGRRLAVECLATPVPWKASRKRDRNLKHGSQGVGVTMEPGQYVQKAFGTRPRKRYFQFCTWGVRTKQSLGLVEGMRTSLPHPLPCCRHHPEYPVRDLILTTGSIALSVAR